MAQKGMQHPNRLRSLLKEAGLTIREVHRETNIPESTLYYWAAGHGIIPREQPALAESVLLQALQQSAKTSRRRALILSDLALSALQQVDVEKACAYAEEVVTLASDSASGFLRSNVLKIQQQLVPFAEVEAVRQLEKRVALLA